MKNVNDDDHFNEDEVLIHLDKLQGRSRFVQIVWITVILGTICGFGYHFSGLVDGYLNYTLATTYSENGVKFEFPEITLCHPLPFIIWKHDKIIGRQPNLPNTNIRFYEEIYMKNLFHFWTVTLFGNATEADLTPDQAKFRAEAISASFLNYSARHSFAPSPEDVVVLCMFNNKLCDIVNFTVLISRITGYCFTFHTSKKNLYQSGSDNGLLMHIFMQNWQPGAEISGLLAGDDGVKSFVHPRNTWPKLEVPDDIIQLKKRLYFRLNFKERIRKITPIKNCQEPELLQRCFLSRGTSLRCDMFVYDKQLCIHDIQQRDLFSTCGCIAHDWLIPPELKNKPACYELPDIVFENKGYVTTSDGSNPMVQMIGSNNTIPLASLININETRDRFICYVRFRNLDRREKYNCVPACKENSYAIVNYRVKHDSVSEPPLVDFMYNVTLKMLNEVNHKGWDNSTNAYRMSQFKTSGNLIGMDAVLYDMSGSFEVFSDNSRGSLEREELVYPINDLFSDIGATLGIWLGCCVVTVFELMELFYKLNKNYRLKKARKSNM